MPRFYHLLLSRSSVRPLSHSIQLFPRLHYRQYVRKQRPKRPSPSFGSSQGNANEDFADLKGQAQVIHGSRWRRWLPGKGKVFIFSIIGFIGYKLYTWQTNPRRSVTLNPQFFTPFILKDKEDVSPTSSVLSLLSVPSGQNIDNVLEAWRAGVWSVQVMQPELQIARSYTPLPPTEGQPSELVRLFVRKEVKGEVSGFLHRIVYGSLVHLRGPHVEYKIPNDLDEVLFLAGGTGIAPALQVAYCLFKARPSDAGGKVPRMRILWANRRREDSKAGMEPDEVQQLRQSLWAKARNAITRSEAAPRRLLRTKPDAGMDAGVQQTRLVEEVDQFTSEYGGKVSVEYFVDEEGSFITEPILRSYLEAEEPLAAETSTDRTLRKKLVLISGPDGFLTHYGGSKEWQEGKEVPGPLSGMLKKIDPQGWDIWTL